MNSDFLLAVHALVFLNRKGGERTSDELAENICTNPARVRRVMSQLCKAGLAETRHGRAGYRFPHNPEDVTLLMTADALGTRFASADWRSGDPHMECRIASGMADVADALYAELDARCRAYLAGVTIADIDGKLFCGSRLSKTTGASGAAANIKTAL